MKIKSLVIIFSLFCSLALFAAGEKAAAVPAAPAITTAPAAGQALPQAAAVQNSRSEEQTAVANPAKPKRSVLMDFLPIIIIIAVFYIFIFRGNKKQQQKRQEALDRIVKGSPVMLNSGVFGKVVEVREKEFLVEIAENVRVLVIKNGVNPVEEEAAAKAGDNK